MTARRELWAKQSGLEERYPLACHLLDAAAAALVLWDTWLRPGLQELITDDLGADARALAGLATGLHDIGKANPYFAGQLLGHGEWAQSIRTELEACGYHFPKQATRGDVLARHERVSALTLLERGWENKPARTSWLGLVALGHHGSFRTQQFVGSFRRNAQGAWADAREDLTDLVHRGVGLKPGEVPEAVPVTTTILLSGLTVLADRIASSVDAVTAGQTAMATEQITVDEPDAWIAGRYSWLRDRVEQELGIYRNFEDPVADILRGRPPRHLQTQAVSAGSGLWIVMAPTGIGKTEAALLRHARQPERLLFLLPTMAATNAIMKRVQHAYRNTGNLASLVHSLASLEDFYNQPIAANDANGSGGLYPSEFVRSGSARLLAPVSVATVDQALKASLPLKWTHLRLLALANAHVVVDEVHTMDQYQTELLRVLMTWCGKTRARVTLLTATLPQWQRDALASAYSPGINLGPAQFPSTLLAPSPATTTPVETVHYRIDLETVLAEESVQAHCSWARERRSAFPDARLGVICNTVARAQGVARALAGTDDNVVVLHARMTAEHRRLVAAILERELGPESFGKSITVVGTQAIEASLDIDLDALSTDLAPAPGLLQRAGRAWRRHDPGRNQRLPGVKHLPLRVVCTGEEGWHWPYFSAELQRTWNYLRERDHLDTPNDNQAFIEFSAFSLKEALRDDEMAELEAKAAAAQKGSFAIYPIGDILNPEATIETVGQLTRAAGNSLDDATLDTDDLVTRLIQPPVVRVILMGDPAKVPGAWREGIKALELIRPHERERLQAALAGSLSLNGKLAREVLARQPTFTPKAPVLKAFIPVQVGDSFDYDQLVGVVRD